MTGPTGCGKSSLALALVGVLQETGSARVTGDIRLDGASLDELERHERPTRIAAIWQRPEAQLFRSTILDEVRAALDFQCVPATEGDRRAREAIRRAGLAHLDEERDPLSLSGGEQQRLALAATLVLRPAVLVLDEVASHLDRTGLERLRAILAETRRRRPLTVIAFDHRPERHAGLADRVVVLDQRGRIALDGTPEEVFGRHAERCRAIGVRLADDEASRGGTDVAPPVVDGGPPALTARSLTLRRGGSRVLREVSFALPLGATALLTGENGAGKSSLLRAVAGDRRGLRGGVEPPDRPRRRAGIGYAPQRGSELMFARTVRDELLLALPPRRAADADVLLERAGLRDVACAHPLRLSGGQRQRLSVLLATAGDPALLLLDEPTSAQDARGAERIRALIAHGAEARTTIVATHEGELLRGIATHRIALADGRVGEVRRL